MMIAMVRRSGWTWVVLAAGAAVAMGCSQSGSAVGDGAAVDTARAGGDAGRVAIALTPAESLFEHSTDLLLMVISDVPGACGYVQRSEVKAGARALVINMLGRTIAPGTYPVTEDAKPAQAYFQATDAACHPLFAITPFARAGSTLVIRAIGAEVVDGSYALDFGGGRTLNGDFHAVVCAPLARPNPTCVP
jgi:hypothetical protein